MRLLNKLLLLSTLLFTLSANAALNLELTQGIQGAIPIAIVPFTGQSADMQQPNNIAGVVTADLTNSGRFKLINATTMQQTPASAAQVDFKYWQQQNVNDMVVGQVKPVGGNQYQVSFQLISPYANKAAPNSTAPAWQNAVILSQNFTVSGDQLRGLAHHISDIIYQNLTGDKGIFSTRIAYVVVQRFANAAAEYTLEISDMDGYNPKPLLHSSQPIMSPAWSPNGKQLAYVSFEGNRSAIYVQDVATGQRQCVSNNSGINGAPAWSPDGSKLALVLSNNGYAKIYILNLASRGLTQVTRGMSIDTEPSWSPDGQSLIFTSSRGGGPQIYRSDLTGSNVQRVTFNGTYNARASFAPDGKAIVVLHGQGNSYNIAIQDLQSGRFTLLTQSGWTQSPSIAPNGKMVVYATKAGGRGVLGMVSTDDRVKIMLPAREGNVREPVWSPFLN